MRASSDSCNNAYNRRRPHSSLGHLTPNEFAAQRQEIAAVEVAANL